VIDGPNVSRGTKPTQSQIQALEPNFSKLDQFAQILIEDGVKLGLIGPREVDRIWDRHILNCAAISELITDGQSIIDIGSGAGLPGLVLAILNPQSKVTLIEPMQRRCDFLTNTVKKLDLKNVSILKDRAENVSVQAQVVTSRAVAPLNKLLEWSLPLVLKNGKVLAIKGEKAQDELMQAKTDIPALKNMTAAIKSCGRALDLSVTVVEVIKEG
jgi:16S rRNA (guanine527-N7)-methyltransferase